MDEIVKVSLTLDEVAAYKRDVTGDAHFSGRISMGFAFRLEECRGIGSDYWKVLDEIRALEKGVFTATKPATRFKHPPLDRFWHKHVSFTRHFIRNIGERWGIARGRGNKDLRQMIDRVVADYGDDPQRFSGMIAHHFVAGAITDRANAKRMTGDWIIFGQHEGKNYYLDLATHMEGEQGENANRLFEKLRNGSETEFPFLFG